MESSHGQRMATGETDRWSPQDWLGGRWPTTTTGTTNLLRSLPCRVGLHVEDQVNVPEHFILKRSLSILSSPCWLLGSNHNQRLIYKGSFLSSSLGENSPFLNPSTCPNLELYFVRMLGLTTYLLISPLNLSSSQCEAKLFLTRNNVGVTLYED